MTGSGKAKYIPGWSVISVLFVVTFLNLMMVRWSQDRRTLDQPLRVSGLAVGDTLSERVIAELRNADTASGTHEDQPCWLVVVFDGDCPHCRAAAERLDSLGDRTQPWIVWVSDAPSSVVAIRQAGLPDAVPATAVSDVFSVLEVRAVPAAFWIESSGIVDKVWPFRGTSEDLRPPAACGLAQQG